jgi:hypothetical protein
VAKVFGLRPVIGLPTLTEWMIHAIICEVIIFEIKVVKVVTPWLNLLPLENSY